MREDIGLFRGKHNGEWIEGYLAQHKFECYGEADKVVWTINGYEVDPATVGEYSGRRDKNGKRMWEGSIVAGIFCFGRPLNAVVAFRDGAFGLEWYRKDMDGNDIKTFAAFTSICNVEYEVIGNLADNPELLEV